MTDVYIDPVTWRIVIELGTIKMVDDPLEEMVQRIRVALLTHRGEWLWDTEMGLPWADEFLVKSPDLDRIRTTVNAYILSIEGVTGVLALDVQLDKVQRKLTITVDAETSVGVTGPFNTILNLGGGPAAGVE